MKLPESGVAGDDLEASAQRDMSTVISLSCSTHKAPLCHTSAFSAGTGHMRGRVLGGGPRGARHYGA